MYLALIMERILTLCCMSSFFRRFLRYRLSYAVIVYRLIPSYFKIEVINKCCSAMQQMVKNQYYFLILIVSRAHVAFKIICHEILNINIMINNRK